MKKLFKNEKFVRFLYGILAFVLSVLIIVFSMTAMLKATVFNSSFLNDVLNNSAYYTDLCDEITDDLVDIGNASGLNKSFFSDLVDEFMVREDIQSYIESFYNGEKLVVNTDNFQRSLRDAIESYEKKKGIDPQTVSEESINYFVVEATKIYSRSIEITYFDMIQKDAMKWSSKMLMYALISIVAIVLIGCFIFFTNKWKHLAVKYFYYATASAGLFIILIPTVLNISGILQKIAILSRSLNDLYTSCINSLLMNMYVISAVLIGLSVVFVIIHKHLRKLATA
ncbi:MAG: hypothetical protein ACI4HO_10210 [Ruminococcus sp.]